MVFYCDLSLSLSHLVEVVFVLFSFRLAHPLLCSACAEGEIMKLIAAVALRLKNILPDVLLDREKALGRVAQVLVSP